MYARTSTRPARNIRSCPLSCGHKHYLGHPHLQATGTSYRGIPARSRWATEGQVKLIETMVYERRGSVPADNTARILARIATHRRGTDRVPQHLVQPMITWLRQFPITH